MSFIVRALAAVLLPAALTACATRPTPQPPQLAIADDIDAVVGGALDAIGVPAGVAVAVYTPDGVYARGFGLADVETGEPATADTAFYVASSTKSFTALAMNVLAHRGEIDLDATLSDFAPDAPFPAAVHPEEVTLRELLTHTSGISNDAVSYRSAFTGEHSPELLWDLLGASTVNEGAPRGVFQYTNTGYNILTVLTDRKLGVPWQDLVAREIVTPAGMTRATAYMSDAELGGWSIARPYLAPAEGGGVERLYLEKVDATMQSAGGMVMSANDAVLWLELLVNDGRGGGRQVVPAEALRETRERLAHVDQQFGPYLREDYGLGWYVGAYEGDLMIHAFGGFSGFRAHVSYLPERKVGVAVFVAEPVVGAALADAFADDIYDRLAGRAEGGEEARAATVAALAESYNDIRARVTADRERRAERSWTLSLPRQAYAGTYVSTEVGTLEVAVEGDDLVARMGVLHAVAEPFTRPDSIRVEFAPMSGEVLAFDVEGGVVTGATLDDFASRFERQ